MAAYYARKSQSKVGRIVILTKQPPVATQQGVTYMVARVIHHLKTEFGLLALPYLLPAKVLAVSATTALTLVFVFETATRFISSS